MSINTEINRIKQNIEDTYEVLETKGATMPSALNSDYLAMTVASIQTGGGSSFTPKIYTLAQGTTQPSATQIRYSASKSTAEVTGTVVQYENFYHIHMDIGDTSSYANGNAIIRLYCADMTTISGDQYANAIGYASTLTSTSMATYKGKVKITKSQDTGGGSVLFSYESFKVGSTRNSTISMYGFTIDAIIPYI